MTRWYVFFFNIIFSKWFNHMLTTIPNCMWAPKWNGSQRARTTHIHDIAAHTSLTMNASVSLLFPRHNGRWGSVYFPSGWLDGLSNTVKLRFRPMFSAVITFYPWQHEKRSNECHTNRFGWMNAILCLCVRSEWTTGNRKCWLVA